MSALEHVRTKLRALFSVKARTQRVFHVAIRNDFAAFAFGKGRCSKVRELPHLSFTPGLSPGTFGLS
jgi:hypothetical protein